MEAQFLPREAFADEQSYITYCQQITALQHTKRQRQSPTAPFKVGDFVDYEYLPGVWKDAEILRIARKYITIRPNIRHQAPRKVLREKLKSRPYTPMSQTDAESLVTEIRQTPGWAAKMGWRDNFTNGWTVDVMCHSCWRRYCFWAREMWLLQMKSHRD